MVLGYHTLTAWLLWQGKLPLEWALRNNAQPQLVSGLLLAHPKAVGKSLGKSKY